MIVVSTPTRALADFVSTLRWSDLPPSVQDRVKDIFLDTIASGLAGHDAAETSSLINTARAVFGDGDTTILGAGTLSPAGATMANGYLITAVTVCDIHRPTLCHVTPEVIPPALAVAEGMGASGEDVLASIAAGLEITTRVGLGTRYPEFRARGWHSPGVTGPFGGAAAAGRLLGLGAKGIQHAFGFAGSQASGSFAQLGTPGIKFSQARGAVSGLMAAQLSAEGLTAAEEVLLDPNGGLYLTHSDGGDPEAAIRGLGERWELENISLRPWPVAAYLQTVVSTVLALTVDKDIVPQDVRRLRVWVSPNAYRMHANIGWEDRFRARLSAQYVSAVVIIDRRCWLDQFTVERVSDPSLREFATRTVEVLEDPSLPDIAVRAAFELADGTTLSATRLVPRGDSEEPLSHTEVVEKFRSASVGVLEPGVVDDIVGLVEDLDRQPDASLLIRKLRTPQEGLPHEVHRSHPAAESADSPLV